VSPNNLNQQLSQIETRWTAVFRAHQGGSDEANHARAALVWRYGGTIHDYLLASLRDADAADELAREFALSFLRGHSVFVLNLRHDSHQPGLEV
jgi:hypothetical protein